MKIEITRTMAIGEIEITPGSYLVAAQPELCRISLVGRGVTHLLPATPRPGKKAVRSTEILFYPGMSQDQWVLLVRVPPKREWIALLNISERLKKKKKKKL